MNSKAKPELDFKMLRDGWHGSFRKRLMLLRAEVGEGVGVGVGVGGGEARVPENFFKCEL